MIMAQEQDLTFITENIPPATSFIQSGKSLRLSHVGRQEATLITEMLKRGDDPNKINEKDWEKRRESWKREAQIIYPDEGDYKVWLVDPETKKPIPLGEKVEFIGGFRENKGKDNPNPEPSEMQLNISI